MCRLACYIGPEIALADLLLQPDHSLLQQSWNPQEMREGRLNADGYGFGWFDDNGKPARYTNPMPIWSDPNLESLSRSLHQAVWMTNVRSATRCMDVSQANTQPFTDESTIFLHNGYIKDFPTEVRHTMHSKLDADIDAHVQGTTDSEYLFALLRQHRRNHPEHTLQQSVSGMMHDLAQDMGKRKCLLNIAVSDGDVIIATRHALNGDCPSLYYIKDGSCCPKAGIFASEPLHPEHDWHAVPDHHLIRMDTSGHMELCAL